MHEDCLIYAQEHLEEFKRKSLDVDVFEFCEPVFQLGKTHGSRCFIQRIVAKFPKQDYGEISKKKARNLVGFSSLAKDSTKFICVLILCVFSLCEKNLQSGWKCLI